MKIHIEPYNKNWPKQFLQLKKEIGTLLFDYHPIIEHFGSTSVPDLSAKPIIDILIGIKNISQFPEIITHMLQHKAYIYYQAFDSAMPERRLFVRLKDEANHEEFESIMDDLDTIPHDRINNVRMAHIHIWKFNSKDWVRHIAFRDYIIAHENIREQYSDIKKGLGEKEWKHGMEYNDFKNGFIKKIEAKAVEWYMK